MTCKTILCFRGASACKTSACLTGAKEHRCIGIKDAESAIQTNDLLHAFLHACRSN